MIHLRIRTKSTLLLSAALLILFAVGESPTGQRYLLGRAPTPTGNQAADAFVADDRALGAGIAPFVYALVPAIVLLAVTAKFILTDFREARGRQQAIR